jgi:lipopolysaccharide biosynthesis regulator YciM
VHETARVAELQAQYDESTDEEILQQLEKVRAELLAFKKQEYEERAVKYPTDRSIRFQLGLLAIEAKDVNLAMECFQKSKDEPKLRVRAGHELGKCFVSENWFAEAISEFKESIKALAGSDNTTELSIRYDLMQALAKKAEADKNVELAREAMEICSGIARKDISYRDIRECRRSLDTLVKELD